LAFLLDGLSLPILSSSGGGASIPRADYGVRNLIFTRRGPVTFWPGEASNMRWPTDSLHSFPDFICVAASSGSLPELSHNSRFRPQN
jgi:hypothetical protein